MLVRELIEILKRYDPNFGIIGQFEDSDGSKPIVALDAANIGLIAKDTSTVYIRLFKQPGITLRGKVSLGEGYVLENTWPPSIVSKLCENCGYSFFSYICACRTKVKVTFEKEPA